MPWKNRGGEIVLDAYVKNILFTGASSLNGKKLSANLNDKAFFDDVKKSLTQVSTKLENDEFTLFGDSAMNGFNNSMLFGTLAAA